MKEERIFILIGLPPTGASIGWHATALTPILQHAAKAAADIELLEFEQRQRQMETMVITARALEPIAAPAKVKKNGSKFFDGVPGYDRRRKAKSQQFAQHFKKR